jgi:hypothetical protein
VAGWSDTNQDAMRVFQQPQGRFSEIVGRDWDNTHQPAIERSKPAWLHRTEYEAISGDNQLLSQETGIRPMAKQGTSDPWDISDAGRTIAEALEANCLVELRKTHGSCPDDPAGYCEVPAFRVL